MFCFNDFKLSLHRIELEIVLLSLHFLASFASTENQDPECISYDDDKTTCSFIDVLSNHNFISALLKKREPLASIKRINLMNCYLDEVSHLIIEVYPNVEVIDVSENALIVLNFSEFNNNRLRVIDASNNYIRSIDLSNLVVFTNLEYLDVSYNRIQRITPDKIAYNPKFKFLNLSHNQLTRLDMHVLNTFRSLEILHLDHNLIKEISGNFRDFKPNWKELYLQNNTLQTLNLLLVRSVSILNVTNNQISVAKFHDSNITKLMISKNQLKILTLSENLELLEAADNEGNMVDIDFTSNKKLKHLNLSGMKIETSKAILDTITSFQNLTYLNLNYIQFKLLQGMFDKLVQLEVLKIRDFSHEGENLPKNTFNHMKELIELDLGLILFDTFDLRALGEMRNLESLDIHDCCITDLVGWKNITEFFPKFKRINMIYNEFLSEELKEMIEDFEKKGIEIGKLKEYGVEDFVFESSRDIKYSYIDHNDNEERIHVKARHHGDHSDKQHYSYIGRIVGITLAIIFVSGAFVFAQKRFNFCTRTNQSRRFNN